MSFFTTYISPVLSFVVAQILGGYVACLVVYAQFHNALIPVEAALEAAGKLAEINFTPSGPAGIFGLYSYREVFEFKEFWGIGSGRSFALGAMHAAYAKAKTARDVAQAGVDAGCEFDRNSEGPVHLFTLKLKAAK